MNFRNPLILAVYVPGLMLSVCQGMLLPVLPLFARTFDASYGAVGLVLAAEGLGQILGDIPAGAMIRRIGRNNSMRVGVVILLVTVLGLVWAEGTAQIVFLRIVTGVGHAFWNVSRMAYLTESTASHQRGRAIAVFGGVGRIGSFLGPATGGAIAVYAGITAPFLAYAGLGVAVLLITLFALAPDPPKKRHEGRHALLLGGILRAHFSILARAGTGQLLAQMVRTGRNVIVPLYGADVIGLDIQQVGVILSAASFIDMSLFYPAGLIMDSLGRKFASVPAFLIQAIGLALVSLTDSFNGLAAATCLIGLGNGLSSGTMMTLGADLAPSDGVGEFLGIWRLIGDGGHLGSPLVVGAISDSVGLAGAALVIAACGGLSSGLLAFFVPETLRNEADDKTG